MRAATFIAGPLRTLANRVLRSEAGAMLFAFTAATLVLRLGSNVVLTRLLDPAAFGVVGIIISVMVVLTMLSDLGFVDFVVRHERGDDRRLLDVVWTIRLVQSTLQMLVMLAGAWPIAAFLGKPEMIWPIAAAAPIFLLNAFCPMSLFVAQREGRVRTVCSIELVTLVAQVVTNLALTLVFADYRALIIGLYVGAIARPIITLALLGRPSRLAWDRPLAREFFGFSSWIMASTLLTLIITQSDKILFAKLFSVADFGIYILPVNLVLAVQPFGRNYVERYFFPLVSRSWLEARETLPGLFYAARTRLYPLLFAGFGFGIGVAPLLFRILFDHRYEYGWPYFSVLMLRAALDLDTYTNTQTILAVGRPSSVLHTNLIRLAVFAGAVLLLFRPVGPLSLPLALAVAEAAALVYTLVLIRRAGLFDLPRHAVYYAVMIGGVAIGAIASVLFAPYVLRAGFDIIG